MKSYIEVVNRVRDYGHFKNNRTGVKTIAVAGAMFEHDMKNGFPLLTTKKMSIRNIAVELEFFIKGLTDKQWLKDRGCNIWNEWCSPWKVPYGHDKVTRARMEAENDLGPIYGYQWRNFNASSLRNGIDQLKIMVDMLKTDPDDRRMIVTAWNPCQLEPMALPPCHYGFQVTVINGHLNLLWNQRSVDTALGLPYNIASYGILLTLLCYETGLQPGNLIGFLGDVHIYENHIVGLDMQCRRRCYNLPQIQINNFTSIFDWTFEDVEIADYRHHEPIKFEIAV